MEIKIKSVKKNLLFNFIKTFLEFAYPLISFAYVSRILSTDGIGRNNYALSIITYFALIAQLGIPTYGIREGAKLRDNKEKFQRFVSEVFTINIIATVGSYILLCICVLSVKQFHPYSTLIFIYSLTMILNTFGMEWFYGSIEDYQYITLRSMLFKTLSLVFVLLVVKEHSDSVKYAIIYVVANAGSNILNFFHRRRYVRFTRVSFSNLKRHIKPIIIIFGVCLSTSVFNTLDSTMVGWFSGDSSLGLYTSSIKINKMVISLISSLSVVMLPRMSYLVEKNDTERYTDMLKKAINFVIMFSVPAAVGIFTLSKYAILIFSGKDFLSATLTSRIITPIVLFIPISQLIHQEIFLPYKKDKLVLITTLVGAVVNFSFNLLMIPKFNENGAAVGTIIAEFFVMISCILLARKMVNLKKLVKGLYKYYIASIPIVCICYCAIRYLSNPVIICVVAIGCSVPCYFICLVIMKNQYIHEVISHIKSMGGRK